MSKLQMTNYMLIYKIADRFDQDETWCYNKESKITDESNGDFIKPMIYKKIQCDEYNVEHCP